MRRILFTTVILIALLPSTAQASGCGLVSIIFGGDCVSQLEAGATERTQLRNDRMVEIEQIQAERAADVARIQGEAQERVRQADAEVERVRQMQFESQAQRDIAIAEAEARRDEYRAMIAGLTRERVTAIMAESDQQLASLQRAAEIHLAGITEVGSTERLRIGLGWTAFIVIAVIIGALAAMMMRRHGPLVSGPVYYLVGDDAQRALPRRRELIENDKRNEIINIQR